MYIEMLHCTSLWEEIKKDQTTNRLSTIIRRKRRSQTVTVLGGAACSGRGSPRDAGTLSFDRVGLLLPCECWHPRTALPAGARTHARQITRSAIHFMRAGQCWASVLMCFLSGACELVMMFV